MRSRNGIADNINNELSKNPKVNGDFFILIFKQIKNITEVLSNTC
ncbi:MAG TPA: hypothetical protein VHJ38_19635 [Nitrososphaeraceae archaeon]|nr:hypothetical protein [Nitrososphaeraceae archaeon]